MPIPQTQFETWSHQGSITGSRTTYATIREALVAGTAEFSGRNTTVFLQGSYGNDTNIYAESDVDVVIGLHSTFFHDTSALTPVDLAVVKAGFRPATYQYADFKKHVTVALKQKFGDAVRPGEKAIKVTGNQYRRNADVIVATEFRKYYSPAGIIGATLGPQHIEGICFFTAANQQVVNYPKQHSANCTEKHQGTSGRFKPMVRIFKNMRSRLHEMGVIEPGSAPSYFIEGLLFNVPNDRFVASLRDSFVGCLKWILEAEPSNFVCANKEYLLVKDAQPNCWPCDQFDKFKKEAVKLWNNW